MQRKEAEKLLAALIFDDLDEASKTELLNYLQTDNELRERLADMRMAAKVASDTVQHGPDPVLGKRRLKHLAKLVRHQRSWKTFLTTPRLAAAAAIFIIGIIGLAVLLPSLERASEKGIPLARVLEKIEPAYALDQTIEAGTPSDSPSKQIPETTSTRRKFAFHSEARRPEALDREYNYDPLARGPAIVDNGAFINNDSSFNKDTIEEIGGAQTSTLYGSANLPKKPDSAEKWASASSFERKPQSGTPQGTAYSNTRNFADTGYRSSGADVGEGLYSSYNGSADAIDRIISQSAGGGYGPEYKVGQGTGIMGRQGGTGGSGGGGYGGGMGMMGGYGGTGGYGGGAYDDYSNVWRGFDIGKDGSFDGASYSSRGGDSGSSVDGSGGFVSDDAIAVTGGTYNYNGDIDFAGKEINFFNKPDAVGIDADGIPATGRIQFQNGKATSFGLSGPTDSRENVLHIDNFTTVDNDGAPSTVTVVAGKPVTITAPELSPPIPLEPMKDVSGITELPDIKQRAESAESHVSVEDTEYRPWWAEARAYDSEEVLRKKNEELAAKGQRLAPEKIQTVKPYAPENVEVFEGGREGDISKEANKAVIPYSVVESSKDSEKYIADFLRTRDEFQVLTDETRRADKSSAPAEGPAGKEEHGEGKVPILGDMPLVGSLYHSDGKKRPLTDEEKKRIVAYLGQRKSQPEGESEISALLSQPGFDVKLDAQSTIDGRSATDLTNTLMGEDEPDLPPASRFKIVPVNPWVMAERDSLSTFALDVDTASYTLCRRYIRGGFLPPAGAVRMEEFINYFNYHYPQRTNPTFAVHAEAAPSPFARREQNLTLLKIGVKARTVGRDQRKAAHLIFVVDASASMDQPDRLPLVQRALTLLVNKLSAVDRVSLITCANQARLHLETVPAGERDRIRRAINAIQPAGPTNLLAGLKLGYATARRSFAPKQINHVVLCSDGVANVGQTEAEAVLNEVAEDRKQGITITCVGVGYGSYNDAFLEALANQGDGSYMFLDTLRQVHRVFVRQLAATLQTVARDARIQVDFNPNRVRRYRLIGYENRDIEDKRFRDDTIDAGEVGSGQCSTALYELELIGQPSADRQEDLGTVFVRYRDVETGQFEEISSRLSSAIVRRLTVESAPRFFLAAGAARFAEILRQSEHAQNGNLMDVFRVVEQVSLALPLDRDVRELAELIRKSENLPGSP